MRKLLLLLCCLLLMSCAPRTVTPRSGTYRMSVPPETIDVPSLMLDAEAETFSFAYDALSSYLSIGSYEQDGSVLRCLTNDGLYTYLFRVVNETTLAFIAQGSAIVQLTDERLGAPVVDGSVFLLE